MGDMPPSKAAKLKCGHFMCGPCLERIFKLSIADPQYMPPRCCTQEHIPLKHVEQLFDRSFKKTWNRKFTEFSTKNRLYCPSRRCGEWISPRNVRKENGRKVARCGRCGTKVCGHCNAKWHGHDDCPQDEGTARLLAQAQQEGWKRCYRCKAVVELKEGCNHMTWSVSPLRRRRPSVTDSGQPLRCRVLHDLRRQVEGLTVRGSTTAASRVTCSTTRTWPYLRSGGT